MSNIKALFNPSDGQELSTQQILGLIGLAALTAAAITWVPIINWLDYPFRLLLTIVHELSHGLAAILTGGHFRNFIIAPTGSGLTYTAGGWRLIVIPAGYLGVAVFAAGLIILGRSRRWSRIALGVIGAAMILFSLWFGLPTQASVQAVVNSMLGIAMGVIFGAIFLKIALRAGDGLVIFFLHLLAIKAGFTAFSDLFAVIGLSTRPGPVPHTDAHSMAELTHLPAVFWGLVWAAIALVLIGGAIWVTWLKGD